MRYEVPKLIQRLFPNRLWQIGTADSKIHLTFDDGPVPGVTDFVLDQLAKRGQIGTFFMVGENVQKHPCLAKGVLDSGHLIGNHTQHHLNGWKTDFRTYQEDVRRCDQALEEKLGVKTGFFRPPYGLMTSRQASVISQEKQIVMWSLLTRDYEKGLKSDQILFNSKKLTQPGKIVVFHDQEKTQSVIRKVLPDYLDFLLDRGLQTALL
jgi:peptidoglycan-N-acetylglucosamine deacetylase